MALRLRDGDFVIALAAVAVVGSLLCLCALVGLLVSFREACAEDAEVAWAASFAGFTAGSWALAEVAQQLLRFADSA